MAAALPPSMAASARSMPSDNVPTASATTRAAAALSTTMSRCGPRSPASTRRTTSALAAGSPPTSWSLRRRGETERHGVDVERADAAVVGEGQHRRGPGRRQLVEPAAVDHPDVGRTVGAQRRQHALGEARVGDADHLAAHPPRVGHRSEQVEHQRDPDLAACRSGEAERRVEPGGETEPDPGLLDAAHHVVGRQLDRHAERFQHVRRAALRRGAARPVLAHRHAGGGGDERGHRRHVDRVRSIAAGADDVDRPRPATRRSSGTSVAAPEHGVEQPGQLVGRLALDAQGDGEGDQLRRRRAAGQDRLHRRGGLVCGQVATVDELADQRRPAAVGGQFVDARRRVGAAFVTLGHATRIYCDGEAIVRPAGAAGG